MEEIGDAWIVAVTEDRLVPEMLLIVGKLTLNVLKARVELVFFCSPRSPKLLVSVLRHAAFLLRRILYHLAAQKSPRSSGQKRRTNLTLRESPFSIEVKRKFDLK